VKNTQALVEKLGWSKDTPIFESGDYGFFFPGFVGKSSTIISVSHMMKIFSSATQHHLPKLP
jgi:hypothetical protein